MAIEKKIQGTGITAETVTSYSGEDIKEGADKIFTAIAQAYQEGGGDFGMVTLQWVKVAESIKDEFNEEFPERDSMAWFAQQVLRHHQLAKADMERGKTDSAMRFAFDLGKIVERWRIKCSWEDDALRGTKVAGGQNNAAHKTNVRHEIPRDKRFARMRELIPTLGVDKAAAQCSIEGMGRFDTIKKQWNRWELRKKRITRMNELVPLLGVDKAAAECSVEGLGKPDEIIKQWRIGI